MSGVKGMRSEKATTVPDRYRSDFLGSMDGRGTTVKTLRQRFDELTDSLGGHSTLSYQETSLAKRLVHLEALIEGKERTLASGGNVNEMVYLATVNTFGGLLNKLGLKKRVRRVNTLDGILAEPRPNGDDATNHQDHP